MYRAERAVGCKRHWNQTITQQEKVFPCVWTMVLLEGEEGEEEVE